VRNDLFGKSAPGAASKRGGKKRNGGHDCRLHFEKLRKKNSIVRNEAEPGRAMPLRIASRKEKKKLRQQNRRKEKNTPPEEASRKSEVVSKARFSPTIAQERGEEKRQNRGPRPLAKLVRGKKKRIKKRKRTYNNKRGRGVTRTEPQLPEEKRKPEGHPLERRQTTAKRKPLGR